MGIIMIAIRYDISILRIFLIVFILAWIFMLKPIIIGIFILAVIVFVSFVIYLIVLDVKDEVHDFKSMDDKMKGKYNRENNLFPNSNSSFRENDYF